MATSATPPPPGNGANSGQDNAGNLPGKGRDGQKLAFDNTSPGDWLLQKGVEAVVYVAGVGVAGLVAAWEGTRDQRQWVNDKIAEGLRNVGQYSQERVEAIQNFLSEKSLEKKEPGRPTPENTGGEFQAPKKGATTGKVEGGPMSGKEGWVDKNGDIWVPTNGKDAHGGEHYDVQDRKGRNHRNIYPGGHVRSDIDGIDPNQPSAAVAIHRSIEDKVPTLLAQNNIPATSVQVENTVAKVYADVVQNRQSTVEQLQLVEGNNGRNIIALPKDSNEFSPRTATALETAMTTPAKDSYQIAQAVPQEQESPLARTIPPRSLT